MNRALAISRIWLVAAAVLAAVAALVGEAVGEEIGGVLTGKFNLANELGALGLVSGAMAGLLRSRLAVPACILGSVLIVPMQSWRIAPGLWCSTGSCSVPYPMFVLNGSAFVALAMAAMACVLAGRPNT